ncbi:polyamine-transporting ATPase 13A3-like isoform X1 [Mytilus edulis]|uniref:polyamine-transporting ATPase 13A3-like isoform X1 n=1 Tax=Mytilus edulis TaxID=6550 RepID=UPI0039EE62F0
MNRNTRRRSSDQLILDQLLANRTVINDGTEDELLCYGYCYSQWRVIVFPFLVLFTGGFILLLMSWKPQLQCYLRKKKCSLQSADHILVQDAFHNCHVCEIKVINFAAGIPSDVGLSQPVLPADDTSSESSESSDKALLVEKRQKGGGPVGSWIAKYNKFSDSQSFTSFKSDSDLKYFDYQHIRYIWDQGARNFNKLLDLSTNVSCISITEDFQGFTSKEQEQKRLVYGDNVIDVDVKSYGKLFMEEVINPFYIFQICSIILWSCDSYYIYASCIAFISLVSIAVSLYETKRQSITLHNMVAFSSSTISVCRGGTAYEDVPVSHLVPGDLISIPHNGCTMTCDAVLTAGTCIVNESMLTGESVPVTKTQLSHQEDSEVYSADLHKRHTLFSGTKVLQTRYYGHAKVTAVVVRTGFKTAKGELVRGILYPKPLGFKFYQDAMKFVLFLSAIALMGMTYSVVILVRKGVVIPKIILRALDIITVIVPPALPAAMTIGTVYAQNRLKKTGIFCISPPRINFCGRLDLFCFDKTGTLTEDGLDMSGVLPVHDQRFIGVVYNPAELERNHVIQCMATCHSLTLIDGELSGDPLDLIMFESTKWILEEPGRDTSKFDTIMPTVVKPCTKDTFLTNAKESDYEIGIIRQFTFSSSLQRMSVITRKIDDDHMVLYCKGAPEKVTSLCDPETVPDNFHEILHQYSVQGYRIIALAYRQLDPKLSWHQAQRISRDKMEHSLTFAGLLFMQNKLKQETKPVIGILNAANIRTVMITGDMMQTAVSVARTCGMIPPCDDVVIADAHPPDSQGPARIEWIPVENPVQDNIPEGQSQECRIIYKGYQSVDMRENLERTHLAVTGKSWKVITDYFKDLIPRICVKGSVFCRMSPDQKCQLIEKMQEIEYQVGMCGDGANDCEALKAAHAGISLSEAEASVAAPFTSHIPNIECVVTVMREGRCALATSFGCFKYMALYSFIQFISVLILYNYSCNLADMQFLYIDLVITTSIAVLMGYTGAYRHLVAQQPQSSLIELSNLISIVGQVLLVLLFQLSAFFFLQSQKWYPSVMSKGSKDADNVDSWETTTIFLISSYQYITVAFCFSQGPPFRKPIYTNLPYLITLMLLFSFSTFLLLLPQRPLLNFFSVMPLDEKPFMFRLFLFLFPVIHFILCGIFEYAITDNKITKKLIHKIKPEKLGPLHQKSVLKELELSDWPPIGQVTYSEEEDVLMQNIPALALTSNSIN